MKTKLKTNCSIVRMFGMFGMFGMFECGRVVRSIIAVALCAVGFAAFAAEPDAVQLWENGPYFATCNVGATQPEEAGILTNFYMAAQAVTDAIGASWRLPTKAELTALASNCNPSWEADYKGTGKAGVVFTSKLDSSKSILLPAAGFDPGSGLQYVGNGGIYWADALLDQNNANSLVFVQATTLQVKVEGCQTTYKTAIRAVRDTPPPPPKSEISAVSEEGWIDLTVGDRVAKAEETIVVDPAWGKAKTATVKLQNGWLRTYTCASNDLWDTTALTPGRHGMALRAGEGETGVLYGAFFWKTGADWVVLDLPPYSTEGIEFQADTTYLALGQYEFAPDKTLSVLDGAKFEYAPGAGFKGGKLEMTKRYGTNVVEGGFFQIVEKIKGCADNPWEVGEGVEAYTNGTELVISGEGTITGLSEIPGEVVADVEAITVAEPTVTGAEENAFAGYSCFKVTLPDNWQGELPKNGSWYGATGVTLTRMPMSVRNVKVQHRYPWNGKVDVDFDLTGAGAVKVTLSVTVDGKKLKHPTVTGETTFDLGKDGGELKGQKITWDAKADFGDAEKHEKIKVKLTVSPVEVE